MEVLNRTKEAGVAALVRLHLVTPRGMFQEKVEIDVGRGLRLHKLMGRLDKMGLVERGFFRSVRKGRQGVTLLLNGERVNIEDIRKTTVHDGDELAILSAISGG